MNKIMIWSDFACPYCYLGEKSLEDAIKELGWEDKFKINYRAFELDPNEPKIPTNIPITEQLVRKHGITLGEAKAKIDSIDEMGRKLGIDFRCATTKPSNTFDAHRLMKLAEAKYDDETVANFNKNLFNAYFVKNEVLADKSVLLKCALEAGMKEKDVMKTLDTDEFAEAVRQDELQAAALKVHGVPYIVFDDRYVVPGALSIDDFKKVLEEVFDKEPVDVSNKKAGTCDENGCLI